MAYALMALTMPFWQWSAWAQYTQMGAVSLTVMVKVVALALVGLTVGVNPEKKPFSNGWHGLSKDACTTEWF